MIIYIYISNDTIYYICILHYTRLFNIYIYYMWYKYYHSISYLYIYIYTPFSISNSEIFISVNKIQTFERSAVRGCLRRYYS